MPLKVPSAVLTLKEGKSEALCTELPPPQIYLFTIGELLHLFCWTTDLTCTQMFVGGREMSLNAAACWALDLHGWEHCNGPWKPIFTQKVTLNITLTLERSSIFSLVFMKHESTCRKNVLHINEIMQSNYYTCECNNMILKCKVLIMNKICFYLFKMI